LREIYLPPFHAAVEAGVWTLMSAFDSLNGVPASANRHLLADILRKEWGFKGFVVSDYDAVDQLINHGVAGSKEQAAIKAITAGVDMDIHDQDYATLAGAVRRGRLPEPVVETAFRRVMRAKMYTRMLHVSAPPPLDRDAARHVAQRSIVLLKNEGNLLPLSRDKKIAVVGPLANSNEDMLGPWAAKGRADDAISVADAIPSVALGQADVIVAVLGETREMSGEAGSRSSIDLPGDQEKYLQSLVSSGKPVVLVVMSGRPLSIAWAAEHVPAIVEAWFPGIEAGHAIADILFGDVNPSAKLPVTVPRTVGQVPIYYNHLPTGRPPDPEDKYTSKYIDAAIGPLYPFGFGLSYTKFDYTDLRVDGLTVSCTVRNSGSRAGEEIVQLYINKPVSEVSRPVRELKGFQKIALRGGESRRVTFTISPRDLAYWSPSGWTTEAGEYKVWIAPDSVSGLEGRLVFHHRGDGGAGGSPSPPSPLW
ncbi:MAG TPA: glycoside hydrolase family 3 C-terminal domain-containing protein, partial [Thermoanaerobaculia bacterium]